MEDKKMQVILLMAVMCSCAVGDEDFVKGSPCQQTDKKNAFYDFERKHILPKNFDTRSKSAWQRHIGLLNRCREPTQTFIERSNRDCVIEICNGKGWNRQGNLCTSEFKLPVYVAKVMKTKCRIKTIPRERKQSVTVACDKVGRLCLPVHYESKSQTNDRPGVTCSLRSLDYWSDKHFNISIWFD